jgi:hypothetical protein
LRPVRRSTCISVLRSSALPHGGPAANLREDRRISAREFHVATLPLLPAARIPTNHAIGSIGGPSIIDRTRAHHESDHLVLESFASMAIGTRLLSPYVGTFDPTNRFATSWILSPALLFGFRALLSLYAFATLFTIFGWNGSHGRSEESRHSFSFFTNLTYWGLAFYEAFAAIHTASYWLTGTPLLARWPKALQIAHSMFYSTIVIYPFIVTSK